MIVFIFVSFLFFNDTATTEIYTLSLHDALPIWSTLPLPQPFCPRGFSRLPSQICFCRLFVVHVFHFKAEQAAKFALEPSKARHGAEVLRRDLRPQSGHFGLHVWAHLAVVKANASGLVELWLPARAKKIGKQAPHLLQRPFLQIFLLQD